MRGIDKALAIALMDAVDDGSALAVFVDVVGGGILLSIASTTDTDGSGLKLGHFGRSALRLDGTLLGSGVEVPDLDETIGTELSDSKSSRRASSSPAGIELTVAIEVEDGIELSERVTAETDGRGLRLGHFGRG